METFESFMAALAVFGLVAVVLGALIAAAAGSAARQRSFRESLARQLKGQYLPASLVAHPRVVFSMAGRETSVEFIRLGPNTPGPDKGNRTSVVVPLPGESPGTLHILARDQAVQNLDDFRVMGVRGNLEKARAFLSPSVRRILRDLAANAGGQTKVLIHDVFRAEG